MRDFTEEEIYIILSNYTDGLKAEQNMSYGVCIFTSINHVHYWLTFGEALKLVSCNP